MRALVVDDSMTIRRIVIKALTLVGVQHATEAGNGAEALQAAQEQAFDLILMDWNMPSLNGIDTLRALRKAGVRAPVIMVTTEAEKARVLEAIKCGANDYLIKPFSPDQLAAKVKHVLGASTVS